MHRSSICSFQVRCSSRVTPRYFTEFFLLIFWFSNCNWSGMLVRFFLFDLNTTKLDFSAFSVSLFDLNHWWSCIISRLPILVISLMSLHLKNTFVSSANIRMFPVEQALCRSFMYNINRRGPSTEPWGTPQLIGLSSDLFLPILTNGFRFVK